ncbi:MAG: SRPBCC family protein [Acidobacteria bacterium]|nr:SRPBCC family protein [Acidobacteriota bacterium]
MANSAELDLRVIKTVRVKTSIEHAFSVFVEHMETWWPATHHIGRTPFETIFVEPRVGGRWYERDKLGAQCTWGTVLAWDPPHRVRFSWHLGPGHDQPDWVFNPDMAKASEVEIRFSSETPDATLVELEHLKIERHGDGAVQLRDMFDGPGAWQGILDRYAKTFASENSPGGSI